MESPLEWLLKVILSIQEILPLAQIRAVAIATTPPNKVQQNQWAPLDPSNLRKTPKEQRFSVPRRSTFRGSDIFTLPRRSQLCDLFGLLAGCNGDVG